MLVGGFNPSEKHENQLGWLFPIYGKYILFQTTNQYNMINMYVYMSTINPTLNLQKVQPT